ncbi:penicillin-binding protein 2 [Phaeovibrio sulfidiphilus]|uniref:Penicillin-binding protein 2 n=1 Tax=Phaeovibrio sulfidiphilus TaxID=1220600 RepID=A0A8J6YPX3_9PROT|nr:penicillin-binding protein 2 [Phaeovibrio sulfidiphilus]MBE1237511.1 penicillin-binding protein 2 [Phaeovibrio sulfidiphilus]
MNAFFRKRARPRLVGQGGDRLPGGPVSPGDRRQLPGPEERARPVAVGHARLRFMCLVLATLFAVVSWRLVDIMILAPETARGTANAAMARQMAEEPVRKRSDIVDRNGLVLATDLPTVNLFADTRGIPRPEIERAIAALPALFPELDPEKLRRDLYSQRAFVYIRHHLTPFEQKRVNDLGIPGLEFETAEKRVYPGGRALSHVVGTTNLDNRGSSGLENYFDRWLTTSDEPLVLSIDLRVQHITHRVLSESVKHFRAQGGSALVLDVATGEVMAMVSLPDFEPERNGSPADKERFNRATLGVYEMGSVFKVVNTAMALESGIPLGSYFDASAPLRIGGHSISDYKGKNRPLSIPEIMMYSSNIGSARMASRVGTTYQREFLRNLGLLEPVRIELPERGTPLVPNPWREISTLTVAFGHGLSITPLHLASAVSAVINGGVFIPPTLLKVQDRQAVQGTRVISERNSVIMRALMRLVVEAGSGKSAAVNGYYVGGKTGTADKQVGRGYARNSVLASFVAGFPMTAPRYVVLFTLDDPQPVQGTWGYRTAGWNAAPSTGRLIAEIAPLLGVAPSYFSPSGFFDESLIQEVGLKTLEPEGGPAR